jgi:hypothetical protein
VGGVDERAVDLLRRCHRVTCRPGGVPDGAPRAARTTRGTRALGLLALGAELTEANAAIFDPAHGFAGCIPGIHEVLRRQGLLAGRWCLDPNEDLSPGQADAIDRVLAAPPAPHRRCVRR